MALLLGTDGVKKRVWSAGGSGGDTNSVVKNKKKYQILVEKSSY